MSLRVMPNAVVLFCLFSLYSISQKFNGKGRWNFFTVSSAYTFCLWVTKRCRLSWLTNSALPYRARMRGEGCGGGGSRSLPMSTAVHTEPKINFGDLTLYSTNFFCQYKENGHRAVSFICTSMEGTLYSGYFSG